MTTLDKLRPSAYFPFPMKDGFDLVMEDGIIRPSDYIVCPVYSSGDFQIGVTGTMQTGETHEVAMARELGEEIGLVPKALNELRLVNRYLKKVDSEKFFVYETYIRNSSLLLDSQHNTNMMNGTDIRGQKVGCFIYGTKAQVLEYLKTQKIYRYASSDDITGIAAIRAKDVEKLFLNRKR